MEHESSAGAIWNDQWEQGRAYLPPECLALERGHLNLPPHSWQHESATSRRGSLAYRTSYRQVQPNEPEWNKDRINREGCCSSQRAGAGSIHYNQTRFARESMHPRVGARIPLFVIVVFRSSISAFKFFLIARVDSVTTRWLQFLIVHSRILDLLFFKSSQIQTSTVERISVSRLRKFWQQPRWT